MIWIFALTWKFKQIYLNLCFDKGNQTVNIYGLFIIFFQIKFAFRQEKQVQKIYFNFKFWQVKWYKFIYICVLTGKIKQIDLNFCFDVKIQTNLFEFVFFSFDKGFFFQIKFAFWQEKSRKLIWISALTWKFKQIYLNLCFDKGNQSRMYPQGRPVRLGT